MKWFESLKVYFAGSFHSSDFGYVLFPLLRIFKIFGLVPIKLKNGDVLRKNTTSWEWDSLACLSAFFSFVVYLVGFGWGVQNLGHSESWKVFRSTSPISFFANWAQIMSLFALGVAAVVNSWCRIDDLRQLCALVFRIDSELKAVLGECLDYKRCRRNLFLEIGMAVLVPMCASMVNCIVIEPVSKKLVLMSSCYWFICFTPIMLITLKEFQFYNLLLILKAKVDIINDKLRCEVSGPPPTRIRCLSKVQSASEIPLTSETRKPIETSETLNIDTLEKLMEIYAKIGDGVEKVMSIFSGHLLLMTTMSFGVITVQSYNLFTLLVHALEMQPHQIFFIVAWILVQIIAISVNVGVCSKTSNAMASTGPLLHKLNLRAADLSAINPSAAPCGCRFYHIVQVFSLEVLQRKNHLSAAGFFDMDYKLITSMIGAVTTYLIIIIQFHLTNLKDFQESPPPQQNA